MSYCNVLDSYLFGSCYTDLSVSELLSLKHSLNHLKLTHATHYSKALNFKCSEEENCEKPSSMALVAEQRSDEVSLSSHDYWQPEEKASKLQTLFQISVTALAFLSFGGYLLCLIVQSIKSKGTTYFHPAASTVATTNGVKRIKVYRRSRRSSLSAIENREDYKLHGLDNNPYQHYQTKYK